MEGSIVASVEERIISRGRILQDVSTASVLFAHLEHTIFARKLDRYWGDDQYSLPEQRNPVEWKRQRSECIQVAQY